MPDTLPSSGARYEVHSRLGAGGLGTVYRAFDHHLQRWVAVKRLQASQTLSESQLRQEATTLAALQHPNVVTVYDFGQDEQGPYVVMELIEGETLDKFIARGVLPPADFVDLARQCLEGVQAAHHLGLIHRDLKPSNLMVSWLPSGKFQVKILDFGLARFSTTPRVQTLDHSGSLLGSIYYMAPEQFRHEPVDFRTDLYALGAIFYFTLAGVPPFDGESVALVMAAHLQHRVTPVREHRPDVSEALGDWVMSLMSLEADERPVSADAALAALNRTATAPVTPVSAAIPVVAPPVPGRGGWKAAAMVAMVLLALGGWLVLRRSGTVAPAPEPAEAAPVVAVPTVSAGDTIAADDLTRLRAAVGQVVTVQGTPIRVSEARSGKARYLNFDADYHKAVALVFFTGDGGTEFPRELLQGYVGRSIRVTGRVDEHNGDFQIIVKDLDAIRSSR